MKELPLCPKCESQYTYEYEGMYICPECAHEWKIDVVSENMIEDELIIVDSNGNRLQEGDFVTVIKDLKIKGSSSVVKVGTKVKITRLSDSDHNIDCKIEGFGSMGLKSEFVKKAKNNTIFAV